jgi:hypothetical protein
VLLASQIGVDDCGATPGMATAALTKILSIRAPVSFDTRDCTCHACICFPLTSLLHSLHVLHVWRSFSQLDSHKNDEISLSSLQFAYLYLLVAHSLTQTAIIGPGCSAVLADPAFAALMKSCGVPFIVYGAQAFTMPSATALPNALRISGTVPRPRLGRVSSSERYDRETAQRQGGQSV